MSEAPKSHKIGYFATLTALPPEPRLELVKTIATPTKLEWELSDGRRISYPRDPIDIGNLTFSHRKIPNGKYFYRYSLDNRLVYMIRVGEFEHHVGARSIHAPVGVPILRGPDGWTGMGDAWFSSLINPVTRS